MNKRIEWVDFLKGIAIFLVIFGHVEVYAENHLGGFFYRLQNVFCMPLFFFLSGFFVKPQYSLKESILCIKKKFLQLMIPFLVCGSLYIYMMLPDKPWWALFWYPLGQAHCGYWFLLVLFEFFVLFSICQIITRFLTKNLCGRHFILVALTIELVLALIYLMCQIGIVCQEPLYTIVSFVKLFYHFPFFVMGFLVRKHNCLETMFNKKTYSISSITFVCLYTMINKCDIHLLPLQWVLALLAVIAIVSFFLSIEYSSSPSKIVNYVGRHTMEIYVLHYFFIPRNMNFLRSIIMPDNLPDVNIILELIINSCIACAIIAVTLCFSFLINNNTYVKQLFFGIK